MYGLFTKNNELSERVSVLAQGIIIRRFMKKNKLEQVAIAVSGVSS